MPIRDYLVFFLVLTFTHFVRGVTGMGGVVLALPVLSFFFPLSVLVPSLVAVGFLQSLWVAWFKRRDIDPAHAKAILALALAGLPFGYLLYQRLPEEELKFLLGAIVALVAVWNLVRLRREEAEAPAPRAVYYALNFMGGLVHGALASGGPFIVIYTARMLRDKSAFRATLMLVWTVLDLALMAGYTFHHSWNRNMVPLMALALPTIVIGTALGEYCHRRIPQKPFRLIIYLILLLSGLALLKPLLQFLPWRT